MPTTARPEPAPPAYTFDNDNPVAARRLDLLGEVLDGFTAERLAGIGDLSGRRCLEIGAGNGSVAAWLADQAGPAGRVVATELNPRHLDPGGRYQVVRHDLTSDPVPEGPWDLIHARLVLNHIEGRHEALRRLAEALAPGGALAVTQWDDHREGLVLAAPDADATPLFYAYQAAVEALLAERGVDHDWPWQVHGAMVAAGLVDVDTVVHARSWPGGSAGALHHVANIELLRPRLLDAGLTGERLDRLVDYLRDPRMVLRGLLTVSTVGRRPTS